MRLSSIFCIILVGLLCTTQCRGQRVIQVTSSHATYSNIFLQANETLRIKYLVNPLSLTIKSSALHRIPNDIFSRNTLQVLILENCTISEISTSDFFNAINLNRLDLGHNALKYIGNATFVNAPNLTEIDFWNNDISEIHPNAFRGLPKLREIRLLKNSLSKFPVLKELDSLIRLDLRYNRMTTSLNYSSFSQLTQLKHLSLDHNEITNIDTRMFIMLRELAVLNLYDNPLTNIDLSDITFKLPKILGISVGGRRVHCSVLADAMIQLRKHNVRFLNPYGDYDYNLIGINIEGMPCYEGDFESLNETGYPSDAMIIEEFVRTEKFLKEAGF